MSGAIFFNSTDGIDRRIKACDCRAESTLLKISVIGRLVISECYFN